jgi:Protein of unknown function (DUF3604)
MNLIQRLGNRSPHQPAESSSRATKMNSRIRILFLFFAMSIGSVLPQNAAQAQETSIASGPVSSPMRNAYFGDLHVHTSYSLDAYSFGNRNDPRAAYQYGRGEAVTLPGGIQSQLRTPLDFMAVTDHDIWLGEVSLCNDPNDAAYNTDVCRDLRSSEQHPTLSSKSMLNLAAGLWNNPPQRSGQICDRATADEKNKCFQRARSVWQQIQKNADEFYQPGKFTTLVGFEWTAGFKRLGMLHRNVIFRGGHYPDSIFSAVELNNTPERLWQWLEKDCAVDCQVISIPHNTNFGWGMALDSKNSDGTPFTAEGLARRAKAEPLVEIFQIKGNSECAPGLGTNDEQCNFEQLWKACKPGEDAFCAVARDYVRDAVKRGLVIEQKYGVNPFKYGFIGSTDTHSSAPGSTDEGSWNGGAALSDTTPEQRLNVGLVENVPMRDIMFNPGGLAGVWAEENTRESIFDGLKRRETFATSGTRIRIRFFGGWSYPANFHRQHDFVAKAYQNGVPMGGDLPARTENRRTPRFVIWATKDPNSANLQKIQIIKGWAKAGQTFEQVYDVACSDGLKPDAKTHRCIDNGAKVSLTDCSYSEDKGATELSVTWNDADFKSSDHAFYYARVLENPTCRWSTHDALKAKLKPPDAFPRLIQERAWSSPIWYSPDPKTQAAP